jgi:threonylcarbamoyladenosine tRNA methylthiotransferase MtaB
MKTFSIDTLGCKVNQYESQQVRQLLERLGLVQVETRARPQLAVINTCCVTATASAKSRQYIRRAQKFNPNAVIVACGCLPTVQIGELNNIGENVHIIRHRNNLAHALTRIVNGKTTTLNSKNFQTYPNTIIRTENAAEIKFKNKLTILPNFTTLTSFKGHTRAFLKVQDGCDGHCSYCIIRNTRSVVHSKPLSTAVKEAQVLVEAGHKEIVVTGIFLGAYGQSSVIRKNWPGRTNNKLAHLLDKLSQIPALERIRLSSLEPADITPRLLDTFCMHRNIMPHLHLSLQSGSNSVLKKMCRQYSADEFREKIQLINNQLDRPAITADLIVGFPGETDADFQKTVDLAKEAGFAKMHIFSFSPRKTTAAAKMQDMVDNRLTKQRCQVLRDLDSELSYRFRQQFIGQKAVVLVESDGAVPAGRSERYFMVSIEKNGKICKKNDLVKVNLVKNNNNGAVGQT